ncbi:hypothetical protein IM977_004728, partial [Salmonella enterica subsp. enterica serovar Typhimurium]|nr:hypothetical protein [Salmonella enterica subsp. enterica serovar Typhimurium]
MRYLLIILSLTGGFLSFNSYADSEKLTDAQCQARPTLKDFSMSKWAQKGSAFYAAYQGCVYLNVSKLGFCAIGDMCLGDWEPVKAFNPSTGDSDTPDTKPDNPDSGDSGDSGSSGNPDDTPDNPGVTPPDITVTPPSSGGGSGGGSHQSYLSSVLSSISSSDAKYLYRGFIFHYDTSASWDSNIAVARAYLNKLTSVTPPDYYSVDRVKAMMDEWEKTYQALRPSGTFAFHWYASRFVG